MLDIKEAIGSYKTRLWKYYLSLSELLWSFKWYVIFYLVYVSLVVMELMNPPAANDPIFRCEETSDAWNYESQRVYIGSLKIGLYSDILLFLLAASNMKNHPKIAKFLFLWPYLSMFFGLISSIWEEMYG